MATMWEFDAFVEDGDRDFASHVERFEHYCQVANVQEEKLKKSTFITAIERLRSDRRYQAEGETGATSAVPLKHMAAKCRYGTFLEDALRDRFVVGLQNSAIQTGAAPSSPHSARISVFPPDKKKKELSARPHARNRSLCGGSASGKPVTSTERRYRNSPAVGPLYNVGRPEEEEKKRRRMLMSAGATFSFGALRERNGRYLEESRGSQGIALASPTHPDPALELQHVHCHPVYGGRPGKVYAARTTPSHRATACADALRVSF
ncbi:hypothetical protein HPB50_016635 [Hyalomma asiaticum]|uniref:Uncharacterized protein n=1 Tax=Hyalomma asiaticum TaxID=266040 RepID=A0ACB7RIB8_HYAAI|nr:hypothetical protein HPB50_016635 [Hyalomma asiaticum]